MNVGRVYVTGVNRLYQLTNDLTLQVVVETGPINESLLCPGDKKTFESGNKLMDCLLQTGKCLSGGNSVSHHNHPKALAISYRSAKLIICGSIEQGRCQFRNLNNVSTDITQGSGLVVPNDADSNCVLLVLPGPPDRSKDEVNNITCVNVTLNFCKILYQYKKNC